MSFFSYYRPPQQSFAERDLDRINADITRSLGIGNPYELLVRNEARRSKLTKKLNRLRAELKTLGPRCRIKTIET